MEVANVSTNYSQLKQEKACSDTENLNKLLLNLFYTVSHNLNTYAANITMLLDVIDLDVDKNENQMYLNLMRTVSDDLKKTLDDLSQIVSINKPSAISSEILPLNQYLEKVENIVNGYSHEKKLEFINSMPKDASVVHNPAYLESILLNFCTNAVKYAHPNRFPVIHFEFMEVAHAKILTIKDNGQGIDLERFGNSLFGLNQTFHQNKNANGIGLYLTKYQIEALNGSVEVESSVGEGTTFKIYFAK